MAERMDVVVVGAGQAGLSVSYHLSNMGRQFVILEQAATIVPAWRGRWESFTLVLPNWTVRLPDHHYEGDDPDGFMGRDELVRTIEKFTASFDPEIRFGWQVTKIEAGPPGSGYVVRSPKGDILADNVIVAAGTFQQGRIPAFGQQIDGSIHQLHSGDYVNPATLAEGAVLVVGTGQSGCQIAEELYQRGRKVYLCVGGAGRVSRRYRGKDSIWWLDHVGFFDQKASELASSRMRFGPNPFVSGKDGGHSLDLHQFARDGVILLGHMKDAQGNRALFKPDLHDNLAKVDQSVTDFKQKVDEMIEREGMAAEPAPKDKAKRDGYEQSLIEELDLEAEGITTVIWATGYQFDFSWIELPVLDQDGYPEQERGISKFPGLYFLGLNWLHKRKSGLLLGVGEDAAHVANAIALD